MKELKEKLDSASSVAIAIPENPSEETLLAAFAIKKSAGEKAVLLGGGLEVNEKWGALFSEDELSPRDFALSLNINKHPVEELRYERKDDKLIVYFTAHQTLDKSHFSLESTIPNCDLVVTVGFSSKEQEKEMISSLISSADTCEIISVKDSSKTISPEHLKLASRILFRSREEKEFNALWSFIPINDFSKTNTSSEDMIQLINPVSKITSSYAFLILLWQSSQNGVEGIISSKNKKTLPSLAESLGTQCASDYFFIPSFSSFTEAEVSIRKLLRENL